MATAEQSSIYKRIINDSSDEDNALRLFEFSRESISNFRIFMDKYKQLILEHEQVVDAVVEQDAHVNMAQPIDSHTEAEDAVQMEMAQSNDIFPPGNVTLRRISKNEMNALNALSGAERRRTIDRLNLNSADRTRLINSLWRLRNPDRVRENSKRSYQRRQQIQEQM